MENKYKQGDTVYWFDSTRQYEVVAAPKETDDNKWYIIKEKGSEELIKTLSAREESLKNKEELIIDIDRKMRVIIGRLNEELEYFEGKKKVLMEQE